MRFGGLSVLDTMMVNEVFGSRKPYVPDAIKMLNWVSKHHSSSAYKGIERVFLFLEW